METFAPRMDPTNGYDKAEILHARDYYTELLADIPLAQERVLGTTMSYHPDEVTDRMLGAMTDRVVRGDGVRVAFQADAMTHMTSPDRLPDWWVPSRFSQGRNERFAKIQERTDGLMDAGGEFRWLNTDGRLKQAFPILDIAHLRVTVEDNTTHVSGPNWAGQDIMGTTDTTVRIHDKALADEIERIVFSGDFDRIRSGVKFPVPDVGVVYIDDGSNRRSSINTLSENLVADATDHVLFAGKMPPAGGIRDALRQAQQNGAEIDFVSGGGIMSIEAQRAWAASSWHFGKMESYERSQTPEELDRVGRVHSSFFIADGTMGVTTSVFSRLAVRAGMQEVAVFSNQPELVAQGRAMFKFLFPKPDESAEQVAKSDK